ncbi:single-stranded DNA-binding protein [Filifactor villosus]|uniref:Single-stranded DNA-binding protein n=1 Tax=Filifactor villosus TaxID=29374 RepID=A0ABV9QNW0_9FIRM
MDKEKMININASLVEEPVFRSFEKDGEEVKVANFTLVKKYGGGKEYTKCSVYGEKSEMARGFKKGDLIHVFGYFKERAKGDKIFKNFIVKSLNKIENKNKNEDNKEEN